MLLHHRRNTAGFTLIEAMVVIAIISIIAAIAWPMYEELVRRQHRSEAVTASTRIAHELTTYFSDNMTFVNYPINPNISGSLRYYTVTVNPLTASTYQINLVPTGNQVKDTDCGTLTLTHTGVKGMTGTATSVAACWSSN